MKIILPLLSLFLLTQISNAQIADHSLGLRFGAGGGYGTEISYQNGLSAANRIELDLGFKNHHNYNGWALSGLYHWVWSLEKNINWYVGPGAKIGSWSYDIDYIHDYSNGIFLAAAADAGIEYIFPIGIQLSLNARPEIGLLNHGIGIDIGLGVRYQF